MKSEILGTGVVNEVAAPELLEEGHASFVRDCFVTTSGVTAFTPRQFYIPLPQHFSTGTIGWIGFWDRGHEQIIFFTKIGDNKIYYLRWDRVTMRGSNPTPTTPVNIVKFIDGTPVGFTGGIPRLATAPDMAVFLGVYVQDDILVPVMFNGRYAEVMKLDVKDEGVLDGIFFEERLVMVSERNQSRIFWTDPNEFTTIPPDNWLDVYPYDNDQITGIKSYASSIIVFKKNRVYRVIGLPPSDVRTVSSAKGNPSGDAVVFNDRLMFRDINGHLCVSDGGDESVVTISDKVVATIKPAYQEMTEVEFDAADESIITRGCKYDRMKNAIVPDYRLSTDSKVIGEKVVSLPEVETVPVGRFRTVIIPLLISKQSEHMPNLYDIVPFSNCFIDRIILTMKCEQGDPNEDADTTLVKAKIITAKEMKRCIENNLDPWKDTVGIENTNIVYLDTNPQEVVFEFNRAPLPALGREKLQIGYRIPKGVAAELWEDTPDCFVVFHAFDSSLKLLLRSNLPSNTTIPPVPVFVHNPDYYDTLGTCIFVAQKYDNATEKFKPFALAYREDTPEPEEGVIVVPRYYFIPQTQSIQITGYSIPANVRPFHLAGVSLDIVAEGYYWGDDFTQEANLRTRIAAQTTPPTGIHPRTARKKLTTTFQPVYNTDTVSWRVGLTTKTINWRFRRLILKGFKAPAQYFLSTPIVATQRSVYFPNYTYHNEVPFSELIKFGSSGFSKLTTGKLDSPQVETAFSRSVVSAIAAWRDFVFCGITRDNKCSLVVFSDEDIATDELTTKRNLPIYNSPQPMVVTRAVNTGMLSKAHCVVRRVFMRVSGQIPQPPPSVAVYIRDVSEPYWTPLGEFKIDRQQIELTLPPKPFRAPQFKLAFLNTANLIMPNIRVDNYQFAQNLLILPLRIEYDVLTEVNPMDTPIEETPQ